MSGGERPDVPAVLADVAGRVRELVGESSRRVLLGIAGSPGSGKSTLAEQVVAAVAGAVLVPMDGFHLPTTQLRTLGRVERRGAPDTFDAAGYVELLRRLRAAHGDLRAPGFDRTAEEPVPDAIHIPASAPLVVTEGNYLLLDRPPWSAVRPLLDECWFVDTPEPRRVERLVARFVRYGTDPDVARERVLRGSDADNARLVAATRARADRVVPGP